MLNSETEEIDVMIDIEKNLNAQRPLSKHSKFHFEKVLKIKQK